MRSVSGDVPSASVTLLDTSQYQRCLAADGRLVSRLDVLRRWIRDHAGLHRRLLRFEKRWSNLWAHADGMGLRQRIRTAPDCLYATSQRHLPRGAPYHCGYYGRLIITSPCCAPAFANHGPRSPRGCSRKVTIATGGALARTQERASALGRGRLRLHS